MNILHKDFYIEYNENKTAQKANLHHHTTHEIIYVLDGSAEFMIEDKRYQLNKNTMLFIANFEKHRNLLFNPPYKRYFLLVGNEFLKSSHLDITLLSIFFNRPKNYCHLLELKDDQSLSIKQAFDNLLHEYGSDDPYRENFIKLKLCELLIVLYRINPDHFYDYTGDSYSKTIIGVQHYLNTHFRENISLKETAKMFFTDMTYLSTKFKEIVGYSFKNYIINLRISDAKLLLITTEEPVSKICIMCGFNDLTNFIRTFKNLEAMTPQKYRQYFRKQQIQ